MVDQNGIYITKKQASVATALFVLLSLLIFIAGYFWGKQSIIDGFSQKASQESFNDQVDYLLTMQSFTAKHGPLPEETEAVAESKQEAVEKLLQDMPDALEELDTVKPEVQSKKVVVAEVAIAPQAAKAISVSVEPSKGKHFAALAGFAKKASAVSMINRLKNYKINLELRTKISKSGSGKSMKTWYQVVTPKMDNDELQVVVDKVLSIEHIKRKDVKIY